MTKTLFDHLNTIYTSSDLHHFDNLSGEDQKTYNEYMVNRFISMNAEYVSIVNEIQQYSVGSRISFLFYTSILPKRKQYYKYIKSTAVEKYNNDLQAHVGKLFNVSKREVGDILQIFYATPEGRAHLREALERSGWNQKQIKKVGLLDK